MKRFGRIWVYNGVFALTDYWTEKSKDREVFKFKLQLVGIHDRRHNDPSHVLENDRLIPSSVKLEVWKRDHGRCTKCGVTNGLHFDHIIPYSKGGSSKDPQTFKYYAGAIISPSTTTLNDHPSLPRRALAFTPTPK